MQCVPVTVEQIRLTLQRLKHLVLTLTTDKRYALATFQRPEEISDLSRYHASTRLSSVMLPILRNVRLVLVSSL
jgi:hypothetical protein